MSDAAPIDLYRAFVALDPAAAIRVVDGTRLAGTPREKLFDTVFAPALALLGAAWAAGEIDEVTFSQAAVVAEQITSFVVPPSAVADTGVTVLVGCMQDDRHSTLKNIVGAALKDAGNRVVDLGIDVRPAGFLAKVDEAGARIVIVFAGIMSTARSVGRVRDMLTAGGREDVVLLVAGGPFEAEADLARRVGANGVVRGAESAVRLVRRVAADRLGDAS